LSDTAQDLPTYRRASCGHGFLAGNVEVNGRDHAGNDLYLCRDCRRNATRPIEIKDVKAQQQRIAGR
jgi:hypothetical protein